MVRTIKERVIQTLAYEFLGLFVALPIISFFIDFTLTESIAFLIALSGLSIVWTGVHNTIYDHVEWRFVKRLASDRSARCRVLHVLSLEMSSILISVPLILIVTEIGFVDAVVVDLSLTLGYLIYGALFFLIFDYLYPMKGIGKSYG